MVRLTTDFSLLFFTLSVAFFFGGCAAAMSTGETTVQNDPYKETAKVTTSKYNVSSMGSSDIMLRAFVPKKENVSVDTSEIGTLEESLSGTSYQVYFQMVANDWNYWDEARYKVEGDPKKVTLQRIGGDVDCSEYGCMHYEDAAGSVSREDLEKIVDEGGTTFRVYSGQYSDVSEDIEISSEEVRDFLDSVDRLRQETGDGNSARESSQ